MRRLVIFAAVATLVVAAAAPAAAQARLTLDEVRELAGDRSPALRQAEARAEAGSAGRIESWGRLLPSVRLSAGVDRSERGGCLGGSVDTV